MKTAQVLRVMVPIVWMCGAMAAAGQKSLPDALKGLDPKDIRLGEDEEGCQDSALAARLTGCNIIQCGKKESDSLDLQVGAGADGAAHTETADGASETLYYLCPGKLTPAAIVKQSEAALIRGAGYKLVYNGRDNEDQPVLTVSKDDQWIQVSTYIYRDYSAYVLTTIKIALEPPVTAEGMSDELKGAGKFLLAGISFEGDTDKLNGDSEKALAELASALGKQPEVRIRIDVHTDNLEGPKTSLEMSQKRAVALSAWLERHGVTKERVVAQGQGSSKPIGDNENDEGRAKNRRIEIVKL